jgi:hypothetical protein
MLGKEIYAKNKLSWEHGIIKNWVIYNILNKIKNVFILKGWNGKNMVPLFQ